MLTDAELFAFLPSNQQARLASAIGRRLVEVERLFTLDVAAFISYTRFAAGEYFARNSGPTQFRFEGGETHPLAVWGEQLSIIVLPEPLTTDGDATLYKLTEIAPPPHRLRACLGRVCNDVRIWTLREDFASEEAKQVAVSYLFSGGDELFYATYLHGDLSADYVLPGEDVPRESVAACFSIAAGGYIDAGA